jgi:hypothetical protein
MARDGMVRLVAGATLAASLGASVLLTGEVSASYGRAKLGYADRAEDSDPPEVGLGIAMGAFRGLFVNWLWLRANKAKDKGNYYEAYNLAKTITKLQPRFPRVWAFHAWNMAYNISVVTQTQEERWQWVSDGIRLLRDEGIPANPNDLLVHKELAWIFLHKIQAHMDDANQFYKWALANEWQVVMGPPPRGSGPGRPRAQVVDEFVAWVERVSRAKDTLEDIYRERPSVEALVKRISDEAGIDVRTAEGQRAVLRDWEGARAFLRLQGSLTNVTMGGFRTRLAGVLSDQSLLDDWRMLEPFLRKRLLVDTYHMEPERMVAYTKKFGPLDWRHASAHAVYWAQRGVDEALNRVEARNAADFDFLNTDRIVIQAIQDLFRSGTIYFNPMRPRAYLAVPNPDFIPAYRANLNSMIEREINQFIAQRGNDSQNPFNLYRAGYENFTGDAIAFLYRRGLKDEAKAQQVELLADFKLHRLNTWDPDLENRLSAPLDEFVLKQIGDRITSPDIARAEVFASLIDAFTALLSGDSERFANAFAYAKGFHAAYMAEQYRMVGVDDTKARMEIMPKDWNECAMFIFVQILGSFGVEEASIMFRNAPDDLKALAYDTLAEVIKPGMDAAVAENPRQPGFEAFFPKPPNLEMYRAQRASQKPPAVKRSDTEVK